ncbi:phytoene synthase [Ferrithrix thermotolerans DSM 19514]|uniref:Phytoene synthase n=1 Tax=Ferrithrix thermotolerans DSM 19514 TaxID=1121881 RepID=A0A1M4X1J8_9ACTN|nr:phytoene/squalene synthase family protein [Ferrithrix thermotolerans]SHE87378.1 phytoene synthase [Ferrithrix thermotolerans DSM 19514]
MGDERELELSYKRCKELNKRFGKTYYYSTLILPRAKRPHVHALYGFCRYVDDIVDELGPVPTSTRISAVDEFEDRFFADLEAGHSKDEVLAAVVDTVRRFDIPTEFFKRFMNSMKMDFVKARYQSLDELIEYMDGSAAVIGEMMLPVLDPSDIKAATKAARDLGFAFQLTNFIRDVSEDLDRGRIYLPFKDLERFDALSDFESKRATPKVKEFLRYEISTARSFYRASIEGDRYLRGSALQCIRAARVLYGRILDKVELLDYDVFSARAQVGALEKAWVVGVSTLSRK